MVLESSGKRVIIDGRGHLLGRLASIVAKELLMGQRVVVVRCEEINISGSFYRSKLRYLSFLRKRTNVNPKKGPFHLRAPSKIFWRTVRGMLPHKLARGKAALARLKVAEGIPPPYNKLKRMVVPEALRVVVLRPQREFCVLGRLSFEMGWKYKDVVAKLEEKRKVRSAAHYAKGKAVKGKRNLAAKAIGKDIAASSAILAANGF
eukprot:TRINITY_DN16821_c0_g1_i1.p1 TRINITY_DN16821_c0_g1~~TRINITY_DN16821_c0_g1_i1.p1  ORF type:complete len:205 (-),score=63.54 TRINITY_DN16821_c0_g1_i1:230-844(-)